MSIQRLRYHLMHRSRVLSEDLKLSMCRREYSTRKEETRLHFIGSCRRLAHPISDSNSEDSPIRYTHTRTSPQPAYARDSLSAGLSTGCVRLM
jgi:hypothetical protein